MTLVDADRGDLAAFVDELMRYPGSPAPAGARHSESAVGSAGLKAEMKRRLQLSLWP
jgi:hypothetical protein